MVALSPLRAQQHVWFGLNVKIKIEKSIIFSKIHFQFRVPEKKQKVIKLI